MDLSNTVAIITGAAGNLGAAVAARFRSAGARIALVDHSPDRLARSHEAGPDCLLLGGVDLTAEDNVQGMAAAARDHFGRIDALVHTVGGFRGGTPVEDEPLSTWDRLMTVNLHTTVLACRAVLPSMRDQGGGAIVTVSAGAALSAPAGLAAYSAAKAAVLRLTESLAAEVKAQGIRVNSVLPSTIDTPQNRQAMPDADPSAWVRPGEIADVIAFLVSDAGRAVTGAAIPVTGGGAGRRAG